MADGAGAAVRRHRAPRETASVFFSGGNKAGGAMSQLSFAGRVSETVLATCRARDEGAQISSILRDDQGRTVVRVRAGSGNPVGLLRALRELWPLARTAVIENALDGSCEAQIIVPRERDEAAQARRRAESLRVACVLRMATLLLLAAAVALYARDVAAGQMSVNATEEL